MSETESIEIVASPATSGATWAIEKDGINTKMDFGKNYTAVVVTSSTGAKNKYEINTTKLTKEMYVMVQNQSLVWIARQVIAASTPVFFKEPMFCHAWFL